MMKRLYIVRHCEAEGQPPESELTATGRNQAEELADFFSNKTIHKIIASPFTRAQQSIRPTSNELGIPIETEDRLSERILSTVDDADWLNKLRTSFEDLDLKLPGGESSQEAMDRVMDVINDALVGEGEHVILVTHGNLMALLLKNFDEQFGFEDWQNLRNPDVFLLEMEDGQVNKERVWKTENM